MIYILLCGGMGKRINNYSLPKPLNYIYGRHMIEYLIENIPSKDIYIIYNNFLDEYQFQTILLNKCNTKTIHFFSVDYMTRGAVETAYIGIQGFASLLSVEENIVFIDNDNLHTFPKEIPVFQNDFIGYSIDYHKTNYSFICIDSKNECITNIVEKDKISDFYCCGFYGFKNFIHFLSIAKELLDENKKTKNEFYFSQLYKHSLSKEEIIKPFFIENTQHLGTYEEIITQALLTPSNDSLSKIKIQKKLRFCFNLYNTLLSYPMISGDYSTVKPIKKMINTLRNLKNDGHEIVIYTSRNMFVDNHNVDKVIKDIELLTIQTLEKMDIPYDELIFGKPNADIYIDDLSINPYHQSLSYFGFFMKEEEFLPNKINNNKYNYIEKKNQIITKTGPEKFIRGELFYYKNIPENLKYHFPTFLGYSEIRENKIVNNQEESEENKIQIKMEYIQGIPLYYLYKNKLLTTKHIDELFDILDIFHSTVINNEIKKEDVLENYYSKLEKRFFEHREDYPFENSLEIYNSVIDNLRKNDSNLQIVDMIHGDFWFSNILLTYEDQYKFIDMRGQINGKLTLAGDIYYDYGKLFQSVLGYDLILNGVQINNSWKTYQQTIENYFIKKIKDKNLNIDYLRSVTKGLIFGVFNFLLEVDSEIKTNIWNLIQEI